MREVCLDCLPPDVTTPQGCAALEFSPPPQNRTRRCWECGRFRPARTRPTRRVAPSQGQTQAHGRRKRPAAPAGKAARAPGRPPPLAPRQQQAVLQAPEVVFYQLEVGPAPLGPAESPADKGVLVKAHLPQLHFIALGPAPQPLLPRGRGKDGEEQAAQV